MWHDWDILEAWHAVEGGGGGLTKQHVARDVFGGRSPRDHSKLMSTDISIFKNFKTHTLDIFHWNNARPLASGKWVGFFIMSAKSSFMKSESADIIWIYKSDIVLWTPKIYTHPPHSSTWPGGWGLTLLCAAKSRQPRAASWSIPMSMKLHSMGLQLTGCTVTTILLWLNSKSKLTRRKVVFFEIYMYYNYSKHSLLWKPVSRVSAASSIVP